VTSVMGPVLTELFAPKMRDEAALSGETGSSAIAANMR